jgi:hypothetical protein
VVEQVVSRVRFSFRLGEFFDYSYPKTLVYMTQRTRLDAFLAENAASAGAELREEAPLRELTLSDAGLDLAAMDPGASLWQAGGHPRGVTSGTVYARFRRYLQAAGLPLCGLHILRHSAAKLRRDAGESIEAVSAFLDHSNLAVTTTYLRRLEGSTDSAWAEVAAAIGV